MRSLYSRNSNKNIQPVQVSCLPAKVMRTTLDQKLKKQQSKFITLLKTISRLDRLWFHQTQSQHGKSFILV